MTSATSSRLSVLVSGPVNPASHARHFTGRPAIAFFIESRLPYYPFERRLMPEKPSLQLICSGKYAGLFVGNTAAFSF